MRRYTYRGRRHVIREAFLTGLVRGLASGFIRALWRR